MVHVMPRAVYDKLYFTENYSREIGEKRERMMRDSAISRKNATDMPNATTVVLMEDTPDGGVTVTTGDFVAFFNKRCGYDRVGEFRRTMAKARENDDLNRAKEHRIAGTQRAQGAHTFPCKTPPDAAFLLRQGCFRLDDGAGSQHFGWYFADA